LGKEGDGEELGCWSEICRCLKSILRAELVSTLEFSQEGEEKGLKRQAGPDHTDCPGAARQRLTRAEDHKEARQLFTRITEILPAVASGPFPHLHFSPFYRIAHWVSSS
jgi:hypothetical protein